jgi:hypothetical protein
MAKRHCRPSRQYRYEHYDPTESVDENSGEPVDEGATGHSHVN